MGAMAATLAHELNQPLAAISNYVAGVRHAMTGRRVGAPGARKRSRRDRQMRDARRRHHPQLPVADRRQRGEAAGGRSQSLIREAGRSPWPATTGEVDLRFELADGILLRRPVQFQQVLINLIKNAVEAVQASPRREIPVSTALAGGVLAIRVDDSGPAFRPK